MSDTVPLRAWVRENGWRVAFAAVAVALAAFCWYDPVVAVFAVVPPLVWCALPGRRGTLIGLVLLLVAAGVLLPRLLSGWGPSVLDVCLFLPLLTGMICAFSARGRRPAPVAVFCLFGVAGLLFAFLALVDLSEGVTGHEGVLPGPSGMRVVEGEQVCGSGGCSRQLTATGDRAPERMREYLESRGFTAPGDTADWNCRTTGLVVTYKVCAQVKDVSPTEARVHWWI